MSQKTTAHAKTQFSWRVFLWAELWGEDDFIARRLGSSASGAAFYCNEERQRQSRHNAPKMISMLECQPTTMA
jgi:hypothetical protein